MPRVVLDPGTAAGLPHHLHVEQRPLSQALRLEQLPLALEPGDPLVELFTDAIERPQQLLPGRHVVRRREHLEGLDVTDDLAGQWIDLDDALNVVAIELDPSCNLIVRGLHVDGVATNPKARPTEIDVVALVLEVGQLAQKNIATEALAGVDLDGLAEIVLRRTDAIDARDARHDDDIPSGQQRPGGGLPQPVDLVVARRVFLYIGVTSRDIGFRLVVVVVADEVLDGVLRKEGAELAAQLGRQGLVRRHDQRRPLDLLDHLGDDHGLARAGDTHQDLVFLAPVDPFGQLFDRLRLTAGGRKASRKREVGHASIVGSRIHP